MSQIQKALVLPEANASFAVVDKPIPSPGPDDLLIKVDATALNPGEWKMWKVKEFARFVEQYPTVFGVDIAGTVVRVGEGVTGFAEGDRVITQGHFSQDRGGYQHYTLALADFSTKIPAWLSSDEAVSIPSAVVTVGFGLYNPAPSGAGLTPPYEAGGRGKYAGKPFLVFGGASSNGQLAIQFARISGFSPIISTASPRNEALLKSLGATHVVDRSSPNVRSDVSAITDGAPLEVIYDAVSLEETQQAAWDLLAPGGVLVLTLPPVINVEGDKSTGHRDAAKNLFAALGDWLARGDIKPNPIRVLPGGLKSVPEGLKELAEGRVSGQKLVVHPRET
ncbi:GroES-like protein [Gloeophyllum trabeum ATCC 11539]|uniref:GroES-like protein n=1 Tax=Gloeophyllum trabeum (strain ATCC 11539 / FP-39264 / Madison 617) TaxID=670483 RepID=S7R9Y8_GLOTA|nr:GroES-like protein [Gloeophyllum trabeum ATCC 11539]EPQ51055.1 GroES-like protein [Gloeophyllum trabeum ATCC 11539]